MRAYHFINEHWGIEALKKRRLKVSAFSDMNDPFELLGITLASKKDRKAFQNLKADLDKTIGALCFSRNWSNPVLWSHYADKHRGLCLGFEIPKKWAKSINYQGSRIEEKFESGLPLESEETLGFNLLTTKFEHWLYEDEVRMILKYEDIPKEGNLHFLPFCNALKLRTIVIGPRSELQIKNVRKLLTSEDTSVAVAKSRLAFKSYKVVKNQAAR
ncbi:MAG: DUF2971 domain-containing protein [Pseudomonadales bacterium]